MAYEQIIQKASFRGIKFNVEVSERTMGFKYKLHVFPGMNSNKKYTRARPEELSEEPQIFPLEAFLIGPDAAYTRDLLISACRKRESGRLQHPQIGFIDAKCKSLRIREDFSRVGKIYVSMEFIEYIQPIDLHSPDRLLDALNTANDFLNDSMASFVDAMAVLDLPAYALGNVAGMLNKVSNFITSKNGLGRIGSTITDFKDAILAIQTEGKNLLNAPEKLANQIKHALDYLTGEDAIEAHNSFQNEVVSPVPSGLTPTEEKIIKATNAIASYSAAAATVVAVDRLVERLKEEVTDLDLTQQEEKFSSNAEAKGYTDKLIASIEADLNVSDPDRYFTLQALKSSLKQIAFLPETEQVLVDHPVPSLVLAYDRYEDLDREADILRRNQHLLDYPGEVRGELECLISR